MGRDQIAEKSDDEINDGFSENRDTLLSRNNGLIKLLYYMANEQISNGERAPDGNNCGSRDEFNGVVY